MLCVSSGSISGVKYSFQGPPCVLSGSECRCVKIPSQLKWKVNYTLSKSVTNCPLPFLHCSFNLSFLFPHPFICEQLNHYGAVLEVLFSGHRGQRCGTAQFSNDTRIPTLPYLHPCLPLYHLSAGWFWLLANAGHELAAALRPLLL